LKKKDIHLTVKRLDCIHPEISGNKWFKLKYNLLEAKEQGHHQLLTFGGAYSNHIYATAAAAKSVGLNSIGIIRGSEIMPLNPTLSYAKAAGMHLHYLSRSAYREKSSAYLNTLKEKFGDFYLLPEGGTNALAVKGSMEILQENDFEAEVICASIGTGGTVGGLLSTAKTSQKVMGFSSLKGEFVPAEIQKLIREYGITPGCRYDILTQYHFGGYAKFTPELISFIHDFKDSTGIPLDPVYTAKMMFGLLDLIKTGTIPAGSKILAVHSGGLQGIEGFNKRYGTDLPSA
jgi:1-aminocyclopropane-1-carboxylate deaminase/D-cysteine desulfhydrase-like pyridoxal-dependent ACC family enzyme